MLEVALMSMGSKVSLRMPTSRVHVDEDDEACGLWSLKGDCSGLIC